MISSSRTEHPPFQDDFFVGPCSDDVRAASQDGVEVVAEDGVAEYFDRHDSREKLKSMPNHLTAMIIIASR